MSTVSGRYVETFVQADMGLLDDVSMNAPYPFFWVTLKRIEGKTLIVDAAGVERRLPFKRKGRSEKASVVIEDPVFGPITFAVSPLLSDGGTPLQPSLALQLPETGTPAADTAGVPASSSTGEHA